MDNILFHYSNIPKGWASYNKSRFVISDDKYNAILDKLDNVPPGTIIYMQNVCKLFIPKLIKSGRVFGIDFPEYFNSNFKQTEYIIPSDEDIYVIYSVGLERAVNTEYSTKLILSLLERFKNNNKVVILCSHLSYSVFYKKYQIDVVNKLSAKEKEEESIF